jgi:hypothetical protein
MACVTIYAKYASGEAIELSRDRFEKRDKKLNKMTKNGLVERNAATGDTERVSGREVDLSLKESQPERQSFTPGRVLRDDGPKRRPQHAASTGAYSEPERYDEATAPAPVDDTSVRFPEVEPHRSGALTEARFRDILEKPRTVEASPVSRKLRYTAGETERIDATERHSDSATEFVDDSWSLPRPGADDMAHGYARSDFSFAGNRHISSTSGIKAARETVPHRRPQRRTEHAASSVSGIPSAQQDGGGRAGDYARDERQPEHVPAPSQYRRDHADIKQGGTPNDERESVLKRIRNHAVAQAKAKTTATPTGPRREISAESDIDKYSQAKREPIGSRSGLQSAREAFPSRRPRRIMEPAQPHEPSPASRITDFGGDSLAPEERPLNENPGTNGIKPSVSESPSPAPERQNKGITRAKNKVEKTEKKLESARVKLPAKIAPRIDRTFDAETGKAKSRLRFERTATTQREHIKGP